MSMYRCPDGTYTKSQQRYLSEWRLIKEAVERALDVCVYAFDPDIGVCTKDGKDEFSLPLWAAKRVATIGQKQEQGS